MRRCMRHESEYHAPIKIKKQFHHIGGLEHTFDFTLFSLNFIAYLCLCLCHDKSVLSQLHFTGQIHCASNFFIFRSDNSLPTV